MSFFRRFCLIQRLNCGLIFSFDIADETARSRRSCYGHGNVHALCLLMDCRSEGWVRIWANQKLAPSSESRLREHCTTVWWLVVWILPWNALCLETWIVLRIGMILKSNSTSGDTFYFASLFIMQLHCLSILHGATAAEYARTHDYFLMGRFRCLQGTYCSAKNLIWLPAVRFFIEPLL